MQYKFRINKINDFYILYLNKIIENKSWIIYAKSTERIINHLQLNKSVFYSQLYEYHGKSIIPRLKKSKYGTTEIRFITKEDGQKFIDDYLEPLMVMNILTEGLSK